MTSITEMTIVDYPQIIELWTHAEGMTLRDADSKSNIGAYLKRNPGLSYVAKEKGHVVAAVLAGTDGRRGYLQHLCVLKKHRSKGLGQELVSKVLEELQAMGISKTHLFVHHANEYAQEFYKKSGWVARDEVRMFSYNSSDNRDI